MLEVTPITRHYRDLLRRDARIRDIVERFAFDGPSRNADFLYLRSVAMADLGNDAVQVTFLCLDLLNASVGALGDAFVGYYELPESAMADAVMTALMETVNGTTPETLERATENGLTWNVYVYDAVKTVLWGTLIVGFYDTSKMSDRVFQAWFEREWDRLMPYRNHFYGFHVVPLVHVSDFVRYQELRHGTLQIRRMISTWLAHYGKGYTHFIASWAPRFAEAAFGKRLRAIYRPLVERVARTALSNLGVAGGDRQKIRVDVEKQVWEEYDKAWNDFEFHVPYSRKPSPIGRMGILGLSESENERKTFDEYLAGGGSLLFDRTKIDRATVTQSTDITVYLFSFFMQSQLDAWLKRTYPADAYEQRHLSLDALTSGQLNVTQVDANVIPVDESAFVGSDGTAYITIRQAARRYGTTEQQLRYLEKRGYLETARAGDIVAGISHDVPPNLRVYPLTQEADERIRTALARLSNHSSTLSEGEYNRVQTALALGVKISKLRSLEERGILSPAQKGRNVVYTTEAIRKAKKVLDGA